MPFFIAHVEAVTSSGALTSTGTVIGNLVSAPCAFHSNPFLSWRLFFENKDTLALIYNCSAIIMAGLVMSIFLFLLYRQRKLFIKIALGALMLILLCTGLLRFLEGERASFGRTESNHVHSDIALWINGEKFNLGNGTYISSDESTLSNYAHIHDSLGSVMHVHALGVTYGYAFETLGITFNDKCISLDQEKKSYCANAKEGTSIAFYLNGKKVDTIQSVIINDLDKLSIIFGKEQSEAQHELDEKITDNACLYSGKCPARMNEKENLSCAGEQ